MIHDKEYINFTKVDNIPSVPEMAKILGIRINPKKLVAGAAMEIVRLYRQLYLDDMIKNQ